MEGETDRRRDREGQIETESPLLLPPSFPSFFPHATPATHPLLNAHGSEIPDFADTHAEVVRMCDEETGLCLCLCTSRASIPLAAAAVAAAAAGLQGWMG